MKRFITKLQFLELSPKAQQIIFTWQKQKGYIFDPALSIGDCIELLTELSRNFNHDINMHGWYDNVLDLGEVSIGWEGEELIDILWFHCVQLLKKRLALGVLGELG
jgi:hypothetical protein